MRLYTGTSGFGYDAWRGPFYPADLAADGWLAFYAGRLSAVEINNTFYRMPRRSVVAGWRQQVPDAFRFAVKASRRITWQAKLKDAGELVSALEEALVELGPTRGPVLFQVPRFVRADADLLAAFLAGLPPAMRPVLEFAHPSWDSAGIRAVLAQHRAAVCANDEDQPGLPELHATAPFGYLRLRQADYPPPALAALAAAIRAQPWEEAYAFFKHEDAGAGPRLAQQFAAVFAGAESA